MADGRSVLHFRLWRRDGTWETIPPQLREQLRTRLGRHPTPSAAIIESQSVKTTPGGVRGSGSDGGKPVKGRQRHLLVDTQGLIVQAVV